MFTSSLFNYIAFDTQEKRNLLHRVVRMRSRVLCNFLTIPNLLRWLKVQFSKILYAVNHYQQNFFEFSKEEALRKIVLHSQLLNQVRGLLV